ncbi:MAG TPA: HDIG domain-containing protein [bacterium]|nr:HDIG domain-containing protein [bacterium]
MTREQAVRLIDENVTNRNLKKHMLAVESVMRHLARHLKEDEDKWALAGLLHDLDYDSTENDFSKHGLRTVEMLADTDVPEDVVYAIKSHPGHFPRKSLMDKALYAADPVTGLIVAAALMHPDRKLAGVDVDFLERRFGEKRFAAGADRDQIRSCEELGISLRDFLQIALNAMQEIHDDLGL